MRGGLALLLLAALPAWAQVTVEQPWSRATPPGSKIGVGFLRLKNAGGAHLMLMGLQRPLALKLESGAELMAELTVAEMGARSPDRPRH